MTDHQRLIYLGIAMALGYALLAKDAYEFMKSKTNHRLGALVLAPFFIIIMPIVWAVTTWRKKQ